MALYVAVCEKLGVREIETVDEDVTDGVTDVEYEAVTVVDVVYEPELDTVADAVYDADRLVLYEVDKDTVPVTEYVVVSDTVNEALKVAVAVLLAENDGVIVTDDVTDVDVDCDTVGE